MQKSISILSVLLLVTGQVSAEWKQEKSRIEFLLKEISEVQGVFIRNDQTHAPAAAVMHLRMKLKNAMNSWFAPKKEVWTAELFIDQLASKSSLSGKLYLIKFKDGTVVPAGKWLHQKLAQAPNYR